MLIIGNSFATEMVIMENDNPSQLENEFLSSIMISYADIMADVILKKNLTIHLKIIEDDLAMLNEFIDGKEKLKENPLRFYRIANMLFRMKDVILRKITNLGN